MQVLEFGRQLLFLSVCLTGVIFALSLLGVALKDRRFVVSSRVGFYALLVLIGGSAACLVHGFITGQYGNEYIFQYSERKLATPYKFAGLWAGLDGSLLFWSLILSGFAAAVAFQHRFSSRHPVGRRLEPYVYLVLAVVVGFFVLVTYNVTNPFEEMPLETRLRHSPDGIIRDGHGLNPQLENYWMIIHPPCLYFGLVGWAVPFAFAVAALLAGEMGDYWIKVTRRWALVAWTILTFGVILGGLWAYEMLGWGGYWAWDPVENASILPWFAGTAFVHSIMVQERRDMLKGWNVFLIFLTFFMTIVATYMTRSGVVDSFHAFSEGEVGKYFIPFMLGIALFGAFLIGIRTPFLRGRHKLESYFSREAAFFFNNLILIALMVTVYILSMFGKISHDFAMEKHTAGAVAYNMVTTPLFLMLLFLTGLGPQLGWVKTSKRSLWRRIFWPAVLSVVATLAVLPVWVMKDTLPSPFAGKFFSGWALVEKLHYYSMSLGIGFAVFIIATVLAELYRGARSRVRYREEGRAAAVMNVVLGNNRRYGGYIVHVGLAVLAIGVVWSANFRIHEDMQLSRGARTPVGDSGVNVTWIDSETLPSGAPYVGQALVFEIRDKSGQLITTLRPEFRSYPKQETPLRVPAISRNFIDDYYIHFMFKDSERIQFDIFINPLVNWIWAGTLMMLFGGIFAALPISRRRVGLVD